MLRCLTFAVAVWLAVTGQVRGAAEFWLSGTGFIPPGSAFPTGPTAVPEFQPRTGSSQTIYIWGRPDTAEMLVNLSLNVVAETQPCTPTCAPSAIIFTGATLYNDPFPVGGPTMMRFEYVDDSSSDPPLPIETPNRIEGLEGLTVFNTEGDYPAVGIGSIADSRYSAANTSWLIAAIDYDVFLTGAYTQTRLFLEIGPIGMTYDDESTTSVSVVFGHLGDTAMNADTQRGMHLGSYDALIRPWRLQGDFDGNGVVALADEIIWRTNYGSTSLLNADHSGSSVVDAADYVVWRRHLGSAAGGGTSGIPEPSVAALASFAIMAFSARYRRPFRPAR